MLKTIIKGIFTIPATAILSIAAALMTYFFYESSTINFVDNLTYTDSSLWIQNKLVSAFLMWFITLICAMSLSRLNYAYSLIRTRTTLPFFLFVLFTILNPAISFQFGNNIFVFFGIIISLFILFSVYQQHNTQRQAYALGLISSVITFLQPSFILYTPLFIFAYYRMNALTFRCTLAGILGLITPVLFLIVYGDTFNIPIDKANSLISVFSFEIPEWKFISPERSMFYLLGIISVLSIIGNRINFYEDKIKTRIYNSIINQIVLFTILLSIFDQRNIHSLMPVLCVCVSMQAAHFFSHTRSKAINSLFNILLIILILLYIWSLFPHWVNGVI